MPDDFEQALANLRFILYRYRRRIVGVMLVILAISVLNSVLYSVTAQEEGVVLRFGRHVKSTMPGLHVKFPWPVEDVVKVPVTEVKSLEFGFRTLQPGRVTQYAQKGMEDLKVAEMLTGDLNLAHVEWVVQYRINDAAKYLFKIGGERGGYDPEAVADTIRDGAETVMRTLVGDVSVDDILTFGRERIADQAEIELQQMLDSFDCGVTVVTVKLQTVSPPESVKDAFDSVNRARQNKERVVNDARGERNRLIPEARGKRDRAIAEAEGYRERVVRGARGQAKAFLSKLEEYLKAPEVTRTRLYIEAMEDVLARVQDKTVIDESVRGLVPLLDLNQQGGAPAAERRPEMKNLTVLIVVSVFLAIVLNAAAFVVQEIDQVIITQFGEPKRVITAPGLYFRIPLVQEVHRLERRLLPWDGAPENMPTADKKRIFIDVWARWQIADPLKFFQAVRSIEGGQRKLDDLVDSAVRDVIASHNLVECVRSTNDALRYETEEFESDQRSQQDQITIGRAKLEDRILAVLQKSVAGEEAQTQSSDLKATYGMEVTEVRIKRVNYIDNVQKQVYERMKSERTRIASLFESEAEEARNRILGDTRKELDEIEGDMEEKSAEIRGAADAEVIKIYADAISQNLEFFAFVRQLEAYQETIGPSTRLILSTDNDFLRLLRGPNDAAAAAGEDTGLRTED